MNRTELIDSVSEETMFSKKDIARVLDAVIRTIIRAVKKGDKMQWSGFGTFTVSYRAERQGINPATGKKILLPKTAVLKFRSGKTVKEQVRLAARAA